MTSHPTSHLHAIRASYDTVAVDYAALLKDELENKPFDRAMLAAFADKVRAGGGGEVADLGCGPGRVTVHLEGLGLDAYGIDLSPEMVAVARHTHAQLRFEVGSMTGLDITDGSLAGALAWYSTVHTPLNELPLFFREFNRVLTPGGHLLIAFKVGDERVRLEHAYGHDVDLHVYRFPPERIAELLRAAGLVEVARLVREADARENTPQAFILARKPEADAEAETEAEAAP
ncbi:MULTISPECIES: class I SAM-dependent methyltransferase [unclassified Streptomyces]|uniref:class I SAM-dependent DNA methyltransferase n=1 Tax=unclassified Streptomyces TaxID=2593676 RepID=UPI002E82268E|nr:class I SAM-dependent methyltransferase [Streptomyces sp. NBC_00589]WTI37143.1 class I SAM-dependent methyltransferase [Streptomyces sp. NBC_00775]WUB29181.1 class I SAM-dependent methyltransferase [Streptomyces sp. NBC_00589]